MRVHELPFRFFEERNVRRLRVMQETDVNLKVISPVNVIPPDAIESGSASTGGTSGKTRPGDIQAMR
jgi:hypothetical protein